MVPRHAGYLLPIGPRADIVASLRERLRSLVADPRVLETMAAAGRAHVTDRFTWDAKAGEVLNVYGQVIDEFGSLRAARAPQTNRIGPSGRLRAPQLQP